MVGDVLDKSLSPVREFVYKCDYHSTIIGACDYHVICNVQGVRKGGPFVKVHKCRSAYNDIARPAIYDNVQVFSRSNSDVVTVAVFKRSLHMFKKAILYHTYP